MEARVDLGDWYGLIYEPGSERRLIDWLRVRQNYAEVYWPHYTSRVRMSRSRHELRPRGALPGYMFIRSRYPYKPLSFELISGHSAVHGFLRQGTDLVRLSAEQLRRVREIEAGLNSTEGESPYKIGQKVRLINDLFYMMNPVIKRIDNRGKLCIEATMFGRRVEINLAASEIEPV